MRPISPCVTSSARACSSVIVSLACAASSECMLVRFCCPLSSLSTELVMLAMFSILSTDATLPSRRATTRSIRAWPAWRCAICSAVSRTGLATSCCSSSTCCSSFATTRPKATLVSALWASSFSVSTRTFSSSACISVACLP